jgi:histidinol-phosphate aminotransferase
MADTPAPQVYVDRLVPYQPGLPIELVARRYGLKPEDIVKLASNENPLGMSPKARAAIENALAEGHRYPENYALEQALAQHYDIPADCIVVGNGSSAVLDVIARTYLGKGTEALYAEYAFAMYQIATESTGADAVRVPATDFGHDLDGMRAAITPRTRVIWIANPNNPTGTFVPYSAMRDFIATIPKDIIVVLDEAYYEYLTPGEQALSHRWPEQYPNLIVARTFSKVYGLAGVRVGYAIAHPKVAALLNRVRQPFVVNALAVAGATAALTDTAFVEKSTELNTNGRMQLLAGLQELSLRCLPAYGNFVTFRIADAAVVYEKLLKAGVIVRPLGGYDMADWLRVSVGLAAENRRFLAALQDARQN